MTKSFYLILSYLELVMIELLQNVTPASCFLWQCIGEIKKQAFSELIRKVKIQKALYVHVLLKPAS